MLQFFRKYQSYFFAITTFVIIISFSFFGTYNTLPSNANRELLAFTAVDGTKVPRSDVDEMIAFLSTDNEDKQLFGGAWGPNFLNDGFIKHDLLETGLAEILVSKYPDLVTQDLQQRLEKEKRYTLYSHPQAKFLSSESAWAYFAPNMKKQFDQLQKSDNATSPEAIATRIGLFLDEKQFPGPMLNQVLRYQQKQYSWLTPDPTLEHSDLSLFGYHTLSDWFGPHFLSLVAEFTINASKIAEQKGYQVSKAEALADLMRNADVSFEQNLNSPYLGVANSLEYFNEQLRYLGMDQNMAANIWRQVLLCRRMFQDVGNAVVIDPLMHQKFFAYTQETAIGDIYRLPADFQLRDYRALQKFETYLDAVAVRQKDAKVSDAAYLNMPTQFQNVETVKKNAPELVQKRYLLEVAQVNKKDLQTKVGLKEMWNWEVEDKNWEALKAEFPDLGLKSGNTREERFALLDGLDNRTRTQVDQMARAGVVDAHPTWLQQALQDAEAKQMLIGLRPTGGTTFVVGLENRKELMRLLDQAPLAKDEAAPAQAIPDILSRFTADKNTYYRVTVIERAPNEEIMTFAEANKEGVLDEMLDRQLEDYYQKNREKYAAEFQKEDQSWKEFADVKSAVADHYFENTLKRIRSYYAKTYPDKGQPPVTGDWAASARFTSQARELQAGLMKNDTKAIALVRNSEEKEVENGQLKLGSSFNNQWKWEKEAYQTNRGNGAANGLNRDELLALAPGDWTPVYTPVNGDITFFQLNRREASGDVTAMYDKFHEAHRLLSDDAQRTFMHTVVHNLKEKQAISLDYLNRNLEVLEQVEEPVQEV